MERIDKIENIRDLLVVGIGPELEKWMRVNADEAMTLNADGETLTVTHAVICFVLDSITPYAARKLAEFKEDGGEPRTKGLKEDGVTLGEAMRTFGPKLNS